MPVKKRPFRKNLVILGATGSIGTTALRVLRRWKDRFRIVGLAAAGRNPERLAEIAREFQVPRIAVGMAEKAIELRRLLPPDTRILPGPHGVETLAALPEAHLVLSAMVGAAGLRPTLAAIRAGHDVALANKESLVLAGELVMREAAAHGVEILPVDSEHSAIFQCLGGRRTDNGVARLILTASGGPFQSWSPQAMARVRPSDIRNEKWEMGPRVTLDSATMMNKGLERIEACRLFGLAPGQVDILVHPQVIVHSMVEFVDGSILAQLGVADMALPIQYAFTWPERLPAVAARLDLARAGPLDFYPPDFRRFPCLALAEKALERGGTAPAVLNAADEVAGAAFFNNRIPFPAIPQIIRDVLDRHDPAPVVSEDDALAADAWARRVAAELVAAHPGP